MSHPFSCNRVVSTNCWTACLLGLFALLLVGGCQEPLPPVEVPTRAAFLEARLDSLHGVNRRLTDEVRLRDEFLQEYTRLVNQTLKDLEGIASREGELRRLRSYVETQQEGGETVKMQTIERRVQETLEVIEAQLAQGRKRRNQIKKLATNQADQIDALKSTVDRLNAVIEVREQTIKELHEEAKSLLERIARLRQQNTRLSQENATLRETYYVVGTADALIEKDLIERKRGFLRLRNRTRLDDLDPRHFTVANVETREIPLGVAREWDIISDHRKHEHLFTTHQRDGQTVLALLDPAAFWKISRFLVVQVKR